MLSLSDKLNFIQKSFGTYRISRDGRNVDVRCPICAPSDRSKLKLSILTDDADDMCLACHCWTCGYKSRTLWNLLVKYCSRDLLLEYRDRFLPESMRRRSYVEDESNNVPQSIELPSDFELLVTSKTNDPDVIAIKKYLYSRNMTDDDLWFYKVGFSMQNKWFRRAIFPSFDAEGKLSWYVARTVDNVRPKYESPEGDRKNVIFNEINVDWSRQIVLCEGVFDMVKCGENAIPLLGSDINKESALFNAIVANKTPVALALDVDMRHSKVPIVVKKLAEYDVDVVVVDVQSDPGDMTKREFSRSLSLARHLDWRQSFVERLERVTTVRL